MDKSKTSNMKNKLLAALLACATCWLPTVAWAQEQTWRMTAKNADIHEFVAQVADCAARVPNFIPTMKTTFSQSGKLRRQFGSSKSPWIISIPAVSREALVSASRNRLTAIIFRRAPA